MNEEKQALDFFGRFLIEQLRDQAGRFYELVLQGKRDDYYPELSAFLISLPTEQQEMIKQGVLFALDDGLHNFLFQLEHFSDQESQDENTIQILVNGKNLVHLSDGAYAELFGQHGWIRKYSQFPRKDE